MKLKSIIVVVTMLGSSFLYGCAKQELTCVDLLKEFSNFPAELQFQGCEPSNEHQLQVLRAKYQIEGRNATKVENYLIKNYDMAPLKFVCCAWESLSNSEGKRYGTYRDHRGNYYEIKMYSKELRLPEQLKREDVPFFYAEVVGYLELP